PLRRAGPPEARGPHVGAVGDGRVRMTTNVGAVAVVLVHEIVARSGARAAGRRSDATEVLTVALGHLDDLVADGDELSVRQLLAVAALRAYAEQDLVTGAALLAGPSEHVPSHRQQRRVVVQRGLGAAPKRRQGFAKQRKGLRRDLETQHVAASVRLVRRAGLVTGPFARYQLFQLANGLSVRHLDPRALVLGDRHARELAHGGPVQGPLRERLRHGRQLLERLGDAQPLLRRARFVTEQA